MTEYEFLEQAAFDQGILINDRILRLEDNLSGLYIDFGNRYYMILINRHRTYAQRLAVLREELAHHEKTVGRIIDQNITENRKAELLARTCACKDMLPAIVQALTHGCTMLWEMRTEMRASTQMCDRYDRNTRGLP